MKVLTTTGLTELIELSKDTFLNKNDVIDVSEALATVATSGSYNDLSNKPTIPAAQVNSDWNASTGVAQILNKPSLATVATSGSYTDLSNKPTIPTVNDATLTITQGGVTKGTFTANASSNVTIDLDSGGSGGASKRVVESFTATANQTTFTVTEQIINKDYVSVNVDNVELTDAAYSLSNDGMSVILGTGVAAGALVDIKYFADISLADSGATFTPTVTKSGYTTTMSWSNDRSLPNPNTVNILDGVIYTPSQTKSGTAAVISWTNNQGKTNPSSVTLYDGVTFTPSVTVNQAAQQATLSWTNDGGKTNPDPLTIYLGQDNTTQRLIDRFTATANQKVFVATHDIQGKNVLSVNVDNSELLNDGFTLGSDKRTVTLNDGCAAGAIVELKYFHNLIMASDGITYTPHVSKSNYTTTLSWTNNGGLTNPANVNILDGVIYTPAVTATTGGYNLSWTNNQGKTNPSTVFINNIYAVGAWASASTYKTGNMVTYEDTNYQYGYIAKQNVPAGTALTNTTYWTRAYAIGKTYIAATIVDWGE